MISASIHNRRTGKIVKVSDVRPLADGERCVVLHVTGEELEWIKKRTNHVAPAGKAIWRSMNAHELYGKLLRR